MVLCLLINKLLTNSECISHVLQCETAVWLQQLGVGMYSHLPDVVSTVWIEQAILFEKIFYLCRREIKYISIIIDLYLYTIGFACKYASYCATSKILFGWLQFRWDYKHHHIISRVVLGFSSFTVLSLGSITSLTLLSRALHVALASFARSPSFPLDVFWEVSAHFSPLRFSVWGRLVGAAQMVDMVTVLARKWLPSGLQGSTFPMGLT